ncbi:hypothetical protein ASF61_10770 [Duganella sp. Leaf126]|uniref:hypothetical protein n=1 Tax=Duganella sp. Leaf126 TaxID=1736266 RepID=UPI0006FA1542|nr:hypothetical protein [Duganella sp. Leaf126]KQQ33549.1 hypothetical protein ASF61_10770 [Duganella sp. Leaf126]
MNANFDHSIPVLTEVLATEPGADPLPVATDIGGPTKAESATALEAHALAHWSGADWALMEQRLAERIVHKLQSRVDFVLEQRIRDCMADVLTHAVQGLTNDIRSGLHDTIEKIVARAVSQELVHLQAQKK